MTLLPDAASQGTAACPLPATAKGTPCSIHVPLHEHESAEFEVKTWPQAVVNIHSRELDAWSKRNPHLTIVDQAHSLDPVRRITITEWHYVREEVA